MTEKIGIIVPEAGTNLVKNPSAEFDTLYVALAGATITRDTTYARYGDYSYKLVPGGTSRGIILTPETLANAIHYATFYARGNASATLQVSLDGANYNLSSIIGGSTGGWVRYGVQISAAQSSGSTGVYIRNTANETWYLDGIQCEQNSYYTTYIDGDQGPLYRWTGLRGNSTSTRSAQDRSGGRERDLSDYSIRVRQLAGAGYPDISNNVQPMTLQPGAIFQNTKTNPRDLVLQLSLSSTTLAGLHSKRQDLIDLIKPDAVRGAQAFILSYSGANSARKVYAAFRYASGMELGIVTGGASWIEQGGRAPVHLIAVDPFWYEDDRGTAVLSFTQSVANFAYCGARLNGVWSAIGTGMNGAVNAIAIDKTRNRIWFAGTFTTSNAVTTNGLTYWNGSQFVAIGGATPGIAGGTVYDMAVAANGDVWVVGAFTSAGGAATIGVAKWNNATDTFTVFNLAVTTGTTWYSVAIDQNGLVYVAGDITNWDGTAASDYIASYDGSAWAAVGASPFSATDYVILGHGLAIDHNNYLVAGTYNTGAGSALRRWNGSAWSSLGITNAANKGIYTVLVQPNGSYVIGGNFSTVGGVTASSAAIYNGSSFEALGSGTDGTGEIDSVARAKSGILVFGGNFTAAGGQTIIDRFGGWNGSSWFALDMIPPGSPTPKAIAFNGDDLYVGFATTGSATAAAQTTVTPTSTSATFTDVTLIGPSSASCILQRLENQSTDEILYFNLTVQSGETDLVSCAPGNKRVLSDWRGEIRNQPLSNSDFAIFHLLPGANTISAFVTGTTTAVALLMHWTPRHASVDGVA